MDAGNIFDDELSLFGNAMRKSREITKTYEENFDSRRKGIGDRVLIWNYSSISHINGNDPYSDDYEEIINSKYLIVIETGQKNVFDALFIQFTQDLVVVNSATNKQYRISSEHVKLYEPM